MPSMIENLIGTGIRRPDQKRRLPTRRPLPVRPRDLLELFAALGDAASLRALFLSADFREAEPRNLAFAVLSRWPTEEQLAALPDPYAPEAHLRSLLLGREFRKTLLRRICDAYPERRRLLYVRIPRCAGADFLRATGPLHPFFPAELATWARGDGHVFTAALGTYLARFNTSKTIMAALDNQAGFASAPSLGGREAALPWTLNPPPYRAGDRLFAILREPVSLILSLANAVLARLQGDASADDARVAAMRARLAPLPGMDDRAGWRRVGQAVLPLLEVRNPICTALGDGTAAGALGLCRVTNVELADLSRYKDWIKYSWDTEAEPPALNAARVLTRDDLSRDFVLEDLVFYERMAAALAARDEFTPWVYGSAL